MHKIYISYIDRGNELVNRAHDLANRRNELENWAYDLANRGNEIVIMCTF